MGHSPGKLLSFSSVDAWSIDSLDGILEESSHSSQLLLLSQGLHLLRSSTGLLALTQARCSRVTNGIKSFFFKKAA